MVLPWGFVETGRGSSSDTKIERARIGLSLISVSRLHASVGPML
jgi:hypothetical protein